MQFFLRATFLIILATEFNVETLAFYPEGHYTFSGNTTLKRVDVKLNVDPTNIENYFPDVYKTDDNVHKIYVGTRKSQTYNLSLNYSSRASVMVGVANVNNKGTLTGRINKYTATDDHMFIFHTGRNGIIHSLDTTVTSSFENSNERPVIIIESTSTISVTEIHAEVAINQADVGFWAPLADGYFAMIDALNGGSGILQLRVTSTDDTFSVGIFKRKMQDVGLQTHEFAEAYLTDGNQFWTNAHYAKQATDVLIQLQVTNGIMTIVAWKAGSQTAVRLTVPSGETQFAHEIWAMSNTYLSVSGTRSSELIPETIIDMCPMENSSCDEDRVCYTTREDRNNFVAGLCVQHQQLSDLSLDSFDIAGGGDLYKRSHFVIWQDHFENIGYDHTEHIRVTHSDSIQLPTWFHNLYE